MTTEELDDLRKKAEAATPGPWEVRVGTDYTEIRQVEGDRYFICQVYGVDPRPDAQFIAAANPEAVLRLLDHVAYLEGILADAQEDARAYFPEARLRGRGETQAAMMKLAGVSPYEAGQVQDSLPPIPAEPESIRDMRKRLAKQDELIAALKVTVEYYKRRCPPESEGRYGMD